MSDLRQLSRDHEVPAIILRLSCPSPPMGTVPSGVTEWHHATSSTPCAVRPVGLTRHPGSHGGGRVTLTSAVKVVGLFFLTPWRPASVCPPRLLLFPSPLSTPEGRTLFPSFQDKISAPRA